MDALTSPQKTVLRKSSRNAIERTFRRLRRHFGNGRWLANHNRYRENCIASIRHDTEAGHSINSNDLRQYIAASAPLHCVDGWSLLGRALTCHAMGDADASRHLAYYAELRAAMALLATEGIGVFHRKHFIVLEAGTCERLPKSRGTHEVAWLALEHWADQRRSGELLANMLSPGGIALREWLDAFGAGAIRVPIGRFWLKAWGLDLKRLSDDHEARNEASYRPTRLNYGGSINAAEASAFLRALWSTCDPRSTSRFDILDRHLLRISLELGHRALTDKPASADGAAFRGRVDAVLRAILPDTPARDQWERFLTRTVEPNDSPVVAAAGGAAMPPHPAHHMQVLARAFLLLRVATGACAALLHQSAIPSAMLHFWWSLLGVDRGLWEAGNEPAVITDLWADIEEALLQTDEWERVNGGRVRSMAAWLRDQRDAISILGRCEQIALWGLGL